MPHSFSIIENRSTRLWDYGWFDVTRLEIHADDDSVTDQYVLEQLIEASIYRRSFCETPDPWDAPIDRHGPFLAKALSIDSYVRIDTEQLAQELNHAIRDAEFDSAPTAEQMVPISDWASDVARRGNTAFRLTAPDDDSIVVEWAHIWLVFSEFVSINRQDRRIDIGVIGYD